jgi:phenylalanyl-tRNA synthetase beta chain
MKFSWEWIGEHVKPGLGAEEAADLLSLRGLTVDEVIEEAGDFVLEIDITTNRPDAMNHRGLARELAAITGSELLPLEQGFKEGGGKASEHCSIEIVDAEGCHRFCARVIKGVKTGPSPNWMVRRLERVGSRSIDLLVDITNYVLWELGHPLHGYDLALVPDGGIVVRRARKGERLKMIDGSEKVLDPEVLVIADKDRAIGVGGVMGGFDTEINPATVDILLEGAWFEPMVVRRGARSLGLDTDASYRFERGADINGMVGAIERCCHLYEKLAGGRVLTGLVDVYPTRHEPKRVAMDHRRLCSFAGLEIPKQRVEEIAAGLEIPAERKGDGWVFEIPSFRVDLEREADMFEEFIRIVGFDNIPPTLPHVDVDPHDRLKLHRVIDAAEGVLLSAGYTEVLNYDFIDPEGDALFAPAGAGKPIRVLNPIAEPQMSVMRQSLAPSLLSNIRHNINRGVSGMRIFEIARVFFAGKGEPEERTMLGIAADAPEPAPHWYSPLRPADFYEIKGVIETLFTRIGIGGMIISEGTEGFLQPLVRAAVRRGGRIVGWFGRVAEDRQAHYDLPHPVLLCQIDLDAVTEDAFPGRRFRRVSRFPSVSRDLSFTLARGVNFAQVREAIEGAGVGELAEIVLIDLYRGEATGGRTNLTVRVVYRSDERTLTQDEVEVLHGKVRDSLVRLGVEFR